MQPAEESTKRPAPVWDVVFVQSRKELIVILIIWLVFAVWVVGASGLLGYEASEGEVAVTWGIPTWVFWSIGVPWVVANGVIGWFCFGFMRDQSLEDDELTGSDEPEAKA